MFIFTFLNRRKLCISRGRGRSRLVCRNGRRLLIRRWCDGWVWGGIILKLGCKMEMLRLCIGCRDLSNYGRRVHRRHFMETDCRIETFFRRGRSNFSFVPTTQKVMKITTATLTLISWRTEWGIVEITDSLRLSLFHVYFGTMMAHNSNSKIEVGWAASTSLENLLLARVRRKLRFVFTSTLLWGTAQYEKQQQQIYFPLHSSLVGQVRRCFTCFVVLSPEVYEKRRAWRQKCHLKGAITDEVLRVTESEKSLGKIMYEMAENSRQMI